jgi:hypothetical protein
MGARLDDEEIQAQERERILAAVQQLPRCRPVQGVEWNAVYLEDVIRVVNDVPGVER